MRYVNIGARLLALLALLLTLTAPVTAAAVQPDAAGIGASHIDTWNNANWYERRNVGPSSVIYVRAALTFDSVSEGFVQLYSVNADTKPHTVRYRLIATGFDAGKTWKDKTVVLPSNGGAIIWSPGLPCLSQSYHAGWRVNVDGAPYQDVNVWSSSSRGMMERVSSGSAC